MNEIDRLRKLLTDAEIPFDSYVSLAPTEFFEIGKERYGAAWKWIRNQVIYPSESEWKIDAIFQFGSYGAADGLLETWGELGKDEVGDPAVMSAEQVFEIIRKDWESRDAKEES